MTMMRRYLNKLRAIAGMGLALAVFGGCSDDILPEITSLETSRLFSPTNIEARVVNQTGVRLTWRAVPQAESYVIEFFEGENPDFSGNPARTVSDVGFNELPYVVSGLAGETTYTVRVKAVGQQIDDSKWITAVFATEAEQIFQTVDLADIETDQVILKWTAGEEATSIVLQPGDITHQVTAAEISNGAARVSGLTPETTYTATLLNNGKVRGTISFTTLLDLGGAILVEEGDDLVAAIAAADPGATLALMPGTYDVSGDLAISKSISLQAVRPADRPVIKGAVFRPSAGASLELNGMILDGTAIDNQAIIYSAGTYDRLDIQNSNVFGYIKGMIYINAAAMIENVTIQHNIIHDIQCVGGDFIDFRSGIARSFTFVDNTVYNSVIGRDFFRMDAGGSTNFPGVTSILTVDNNTLFNANNGTANNNGRLFYVRLASHQIYFRKNIVASSTGYFSNQGATTLTSLSNNNYFNSPGYTGSSHSNAKNDTGTYTSFDPGFANTGNGDFSISHEELRFQQIGDRRWIR